MKWTYPDGLDQVAVRSLSATVDGLIYILDLSRSAGIYAPTSLEVFNPKTKDMRVVPRPDEGEPGAEAWPERGFYTVVAFGDSIICWKFPYGGLYVLDTRSCKWSCPKTRGEMPVSIHGRSSCVIGSSLYLIGGANKFEVHRLDLTTMTWSRLRCKGVAPSGKVCATATAIGDRIYLFGGLVARTVESSRELHYLNTVTLTWHEVGSNLANGNDQLPLLPRPRFGHAAMNLNGSLLIFGGKNFEDYELLNDLWLFDPVKESWQVRRPSNRAPMMDYEVYMHLVESSVFLVGGTLRSSLSTTLSLCTPSNLCELELLPRLETLCQVVVVDEDLDAGVLPVMLQREVASISRSDEEQVKVELCPW